LARHGVGSCPIRSFWAKFQVNTLLAIEDVPELDPIPPTNEDPS